ncbi:MAG TPA: peptide chain release factor-like protein, partial [Verrucomicrobiae bacterium]|nr:peptide chain release factor-like protein [Verrucomicrobiae bacterium]
PGGQHRNRRDSAVRLTHRPTGIVVTATERRSQHQNKLMALERLAARLEARNRRRRPRVPTAPTKGSAERRIGSKLIRSEVKSGRRPPRGED